MLERFTYTNSFNETLEFGKDCVYVNENDLRDFAWEITTKNNKIAGFKKGIVSKTIPVILKCDSEADGVFLRNRMFEVFEKDILAKKHGRIQIGDYYLRCYITGSSKSQYLVHKNHMVVSLTVQTDLPEWIKETTTSYSLYVESNSEYLDYPFDYSFDFKSGVSNNSVENTGIVASNFIITIFGAVVNPILYINGHKYAVDIVVGTDEKLVIDSINKTIVLTKNNGEQVNCFNNRHKDSYVFEKVPVGSHAITSTNAQIFFDFTLLEERSEPKWI